jgi:hypothetical protein
MQDLFIDKFTAKYNLVEGATTLPEFPIADTQLQPYTGMVDKARLSLRSPLSSSNTYI